MDRGVNLHGQVWRVRWAIGRRGSRNRTLQPPVKRKKLVRELGVRVIGEIHLGQSDDRKVVGHMLEALLHGFSQVAVNLEKYVVWLASALYVSIQYLLGGFLTTFPCH